MFALHVLRIRNASNSFEWKDVAVFNNINEINPLKNDKLILSILKIMVDHDSVLILPSVLISVRVLIL
jgi:hypothetical protein